MKIQNTKEGGFIGVVIMIVVVLLLMNYFGFTFSGFFNWLKALFYSVW